MEKTIDVKDLPDEDVKFILKIVDTLRKNREIHKTKEKEDIEFAVWSLGVKGELTRNEIYDFL